MSGYEGQEEEKASGSARPNLTSRLYPDHGARGGMQARGLGGKAAGPALGLKAKSLMSQSTPLLAPVNYDTGASMGAPTLGSLGGGGGKSLLAAQKSAMLGGIRTISTSASAAMLLDPARRATASRPSRNFSIDAFGGDDFSMDLPPVPGDGGHAGKVHFVSFLDSLHLSAAQRHLLEHEPHTFFYLRVRGEGRQQDGTTMLRSQALRDALEETKGSGPGDEERSLEGNTCAAGSVYNLEVVSEDQIDKDRYFTLSKEGVTIYRDRMSQFTPLAQWERETLLFNKIIHIRFFTLYRRWKAFTVWRRGLSGGKMGHAKEKLSNSLFCLCAPLREALLTVRRTSMPMASLGMLSLPAGEIFDVESFETTQLAVQVCWCSCSLYAPLFPHLDFSPSKHSSLIGPSSKTKIRRTFVASSTACRPSCSHRCAPPATPWWTSSSRPITSRPTTR